MLREATELFIGDTTERGTDSGVRTLRFRCRPAPAAPTGSRTPYPYFSLFHRTVGAAYAPPVDIGETKGLRVDAGVRDAEEILRRARDDERDAVEARIRCRTQGLPRLDTDITVAQHLRPEETVVDVRSSAIVSRHQGADGMELRSGRLYLTDQRLMLVGRAPFEVELGEIDELDFAGERLLVTLRDGTGVSIEASRPRLLRVHIAAAREAART